ncbi:hypothetical protein QEJ31_13205 [Pigmentibacter sp. JX0631]|uniref:hypothetical protein n=1 Tax=Pigmentibacter sp. JX0631 TaxID=2976982 RepID=UPI002468D25A|nr:hypothetical protein [Pigmentibacter sp. JX0631]WGL61564.1 hypothetical protein QEJ31_13205 [Pigmentibacter sp. JX0631]
MNKILIILVLLLPIIAFSNENKIFLAVYNRPPFVIFDEKTALPIDGILFRQAEKILKKADISYEFKEMPLIRSMEMIKKMRLKCVLFSRTKIRIENLIPFFQNPTILKKDWF